MAGFRASGHLLWGSGCTVQSSCGARRFVRLGANIPLPCRHGSRPVAMRRPARFKLRIRAAPLAEDFFIWRVRKPRAIFGNSSCIPWTTTPIEARVTILGVRPKAGHGRRGTAEWRSRRLDPERERKNSGFTHVPRRQASDLEVRRSGSSAPRPKPTRRAPSALHPSAACPARREPSVRASMGSRNKARRLSRMAARIDNGLPQLLTRTGLDWTDRYPSAIAALANVNVKTAYIDGELCGVDDAGLPSFAQTQAATDGGARREARLLRLRPIAYQRLGYLDASPHRAQGAA